MYYFFSLNILYSQRLIIVTCSIQVAYVIHRKKIVCTCNIRPYQPVDSASALWNCELWKRGNEPGSVLSDKGDGIYISSLLFQFHRTELRCEEREKSLVSVINFVSSVRDKLLSNQPKVRFFVATYIIDCHSHFENVTDIHTGTPSTGTWRGTTEFCLNV